MPAVVLTNAVLLAVVVVEVVPVVNDSSSGHTIPDDRVAVVVATIGYIRTLLVPKVWTFCVYIV
jgi:hypothetical protein